mgnify:CR=1 FL=1
MFYETQYSHVPCAWQQVNAVTDTMSFALHPRDKSLTGFRSPWSNGPIAFAPARRSTSLYEMLAASKFGNTSMFAFPWIGDEGHFFSATFGTRAASTCISPSQITSGYSCLNIFTACRTRSTLGWFADPFVENDRKATLGSTPNAFAVFTVSSAMSTKS